MKLRMGTRGSPLALAQSGMMAQALKSFSPGLEVETVVIKTSGDKFSEAAPAEARNLAQGTKGLFVKEIEEALARRQVDFAVHSAKDLPALLLEGLTIAAYPRREDPRDVFIGRDGIRWAQLPSGARVATSSLRRKFQLLRRSPHVEAIPMRGNVDTRLRKLQEGVCDGLLLAAAGLKRLGRFDIKGLEVVSLEDMLPAPAQGALAVEARDERGGIFDLISRLDDAKTRLAVEFERAFLKIIGGGCLTPLAALASPRGKGVDLSVFWANPDGSEAARLSGFCPDVSRRDIFVAELSARLKAGR